MWSRNECFYGVDVMTQVELNYNLLSLLHVQN